MNYLKLRTNFIFLFLLLALSFLYNYHEILSYPPYSRHTWRQTDCLSITANYYKENLNFFTPKIHWTSATGENQTISEFPLIYFTVAQFWKLFGQQEWIFRLVNILFVFVGLFSLFKLSLLFLKDEFWAIYIPLFLFTSPALVYYTNNFLADAPALGMALTGAFLFYKFTLSQKKKWLFLAIGCTTLAGLLKISSLILFMAFFSLTLLHLAKGLIDRKATFNSIIQKLLPFLAVILIIFSWYRYAEFYNSRHNSHGIFLQNIFPIWAIDVKKQHEIWNALYFQLLPSFFNKKALALLFLAIVAAVIISFKKSKNLVALFLITLFGIFLFMLLWFQAFDVHDYYMTNLLIIIPFSLIFFLNALKTNYQPIFKHWAFKTVALLGISILIYQTTLINRMKYNAEDPCLKANVFLKKQEIDYWKYVHFHYQHTKKALETINPYLRKLGIERNDLVYSTPDITINHTLYLMDQRGFTDYNYGHLQGPEKLNERIAFMLSIGAKYLIINDPETLATIDTKYLSNKIGEYENVLIYKLVN